MKITINDTEMEAVQVRFKPDSNGEPWTEYQLEDGTVIRFRSVLVSVARVANQWAATGEPMYHWQSQTSTIVLAPDHLMHGKSETKVVEIPRVQ